MATGHLNPGYHNPVSSLYRTANSELDNRQNNSLTAELANKRWLLGQPNVPEDILEKIRRDAREKWLTIGKSDTASNTSYTGNYPYKKIDEKIYVRPVSPTRRHNPHPSMIFLRCHMHNVAGFNEQTSMSRPKTSPSLLQHSQNEDNQIEEDSEATFNREMMDHVGFERAYQRPKTAVSILSTSRHSSRPSPQQTNQISRSTTSTNQISRPSTSTNHKSRPSTSISSYSKRSSSSKSYINYNQPIENKEKYEEPIKNPYGFQRIKSVNDLNRYSLMSTQRSQLVYHDNNQYPRQDYAIHYQWPVTIPHHQLY